MRAALDRDLETICARALEREPAARYQSAGDLAEDLERWLEGRPILARPVSIPARAWRWSRRNPVLAVTAAACLLLGASVAWLLRGEALTKNTPPPEKSIAVLPFQDLSDNNDSSDFGAGIQDDVLTSLSQIHELKVISRTSVMSYQKPERRNMREIAQALGVANVLEGSVRRAGNRVLVNVQLIDARNDRHLWAERYDRTVADAIGLQGELATQIAVALKATLAPEEKARLGVEPTANSEAYVLYLTALGKEETDEMAAEQLYVQATALDSKFALAHARASLLNSRIASYEEPRARKAKARAQAEEALRLSPTLGEAHMALGLCLYWGEKKYDAALKEFEVAAAASPNNADIWRMLEPEHLTFTPDTLLEHVREQAAHSAAFVFPIVDEAGVLVGILAKSNLLKRAERQLILVDHNELSQAVKGADKVRIVEILDHHRIGGFATDAPILFWNNPVGSTSTIVALCYQQAGVPLPRAMAGLLLAGLLSDTLNLHSPTATMTDLLVLEQLSQIAEVNPDEFAAEIFSVGSPLLTLSAEQVITADCKEYEENGARFTVSQIEELSFSHFAEKQEALLVALEEHTRSSRLFFAALLVTDINTQTSLLLCCGAPEFLHRIDFPARGPHLWELAGVVSRKKQLLPYLLQCLAGLSPG